MRRLFLTCLLVGLWGGWGAFAHAQGSTNTLVTNPADWKLVWSDEFDKPGLPDSTKWSYEVGKLRNNELQYYTKERIENAEVKSDGCLHITARKEHFENAEYTSASLNTHGIFDFTYGRVEIRAKIPSGRGTWPALWMLGSNIGKVRWPDCGEIDIMENVGFEPDLAHFTVHIGKYNHIKRNQKSATLNVPKYSEGFHVYVMEWDTDKIVWFFDGKPVGLYANEGTGDDAWPFHDPQYLIMNLAYGGAWGGAKGVDDAILPAEFLIDYVRIYQKP